MIVNKPCPVVRDNDQEGVQGVQRAAVQDGQRGEVYNRTGPGVYNRHGEPVYYRYNGGQYLCTVHYSCASV